MPKPTRTKIICTIGPSCESVEHIAQMIRSGMNVARLNFSHGTHDNHAMLIAHIREAARKTGEPIAILQDLQGPKIRVGMLPEDGVMLTEGDHIVFVGDKEYAPGRIPLDYPELVRMVRPGERILLCDGKVEVRIDAVRGEDILCTVTVGGQIGSHKGINVPDTAVAGRALTDKDITDMRFGVEQGVDWVALSFVGGPEDIELLRRVIQKSERECGIAHGPRIRIMAKIERSGALERIDDILCAADGIMVARGDLGVEIPAERVPVVQKTLIARAMQYGKPVVVATQMLDSMTMSPRPTRAEVSDVANAVIDHTDAVMLSNETATGKFPLDAVRIMGDIIAETEASPFDDYADTRDTIGVTTLDDQISHNARSLAESVSAKAIIASSISGDTGRLLSRHRPEAALYVATNTERVAHQLNLSWGVRPLLLPPCHSVHDLLDQSVTLLRNRLLLATGDSVVVVSGKPMGEAGHINRVDVRMVE
jgi:pyruvate kinase